MSALTPGDERITPVSSSHARTRRVAAIGIVAVGAVAIGAALGAFLLDGRGGGVGAAGSYVPEDAALYLELRLEPSGEQDAALRELMGRFPPIEGVDLSRPLTDSLTAHLDDLLAAEGAGVTWTNDVAPWFDGRVAIAITRDAMVTPGSDATPAPGGVPGVVMLGVTDRAAAEGAIDRILDEVEPRAELSDSQHGAFTIRESTAGAYALTDDQLLLGATADAIRGALDAHESGSTLAQSEDVASYTAALPSDWLAFGVYDLSGVMAESPEVAGSFEALLGYLPTRMAFSVSASPQGLVMDAISDLPSGPFAPENADRGLAAEVPGDALYYAEAGNAGPALAALIDALRSTMASDPAVAEQIRRAELALGADLGELVSWIGDGAIAVGWDGTQPYGGLVLVPTDVAVAEQRLGQLGAFAELAALDPASGVSVTEAEVGSVTVTTIRWETAQEGDPSFAAPSGLVVEYGVTDERAIVGVGESFVRRVLELDASESLASQPRYSEAIGDLGGSTNAAVTWLDLAGTREAIESALGPMLSMFGAPYDSDVRPWLLPLDRAVSVSRVDGERLETRAMLIVE